MSDRSNPFAPLYAICNSGTSAAKYADLAEGPIIIDVEPTSTCNMRCVMCPTGLQATGRQAGFMTLQTFASILEKTDAFGTAIRFIGWGEPLLHPDIVTMIRMCAERGRLSHLNTNGSKMTPELADQLAAVGLSSIKFSFQGVNRESYHAMRRTDFFEGLIEAITTMSSARGGQKLPFIAVSTTTTTETEEQIAEFRRIVEPLADYVSVGKTIFEFIDMAAVPPKRRQALEEAAAQQQVVKEHPSPCYEIYDKLTIHWDGSARVCCNDYSGKTLLGKIERDSIESMWRHKTIEEYRARINRGIYSGPLCSACYSYIPLTAPTN